MNLCGWHFLKLFFVYQHTKLFVKFWSTSEYSFAYFAYCQEFCLSNFCLTVSFKVLSVRFFQQCRVWWTANHGFHISLNELSFALIILTFAVDWALKLKISNQCAGAARGQISLCLNCFVCLFCVVVVFFNIFFKHSRTHRSESNTHCF